MLAATLDEALEQWGAATNLELDAVDANHLTIDYDLARDVQFVLDNLPAPSKLCDRN